MIVTISKGQQITIPSAFRKMFHLDVGSKLEMIQKKDGLVIKPLSTSLEKLFKQAKTIKPRHGWSAKEMDEAIEREVLR